MLDRDILFEIIPPLKVGQIYHLANRKRYIDVIRLFSYSLPYKLDKEEEQPSRDDQLTLGERKSLARSYKINIIRSLLFDPACEVIQILLNNPKITEKDVLEIASKRPISSKILKEVFANKKWSKRYEVRKALVLNPYTPTYIALGLLIFLKTCDLFIVEDSKTLHPELLKLARDIIAIRKNLYFLT